MSGAKGPLALGAVALLILLGGFGVWAATTDIAGAVVAPGRIEVASNRQVVEHPDGGVVESLAVREGERVEAGDVLIVLEADALDAQIAVARDELLEQEARAARLRAERDGAEEIEFSDALLEAARSDPRAADLVEGQRNLFEARRETREGERARYLRQTEQIARQIDGIDAQGASLERQGELIDEELTAQETLLERGLAQTPRVLALRREAAGLLGRRGELTARRAQAEERTAEIELAIIGLDGQLRETAIGELRDVEARIRTLREELTAALDRRGRLEITAPVTGRVYDLAVFGPASVVAAGEPLLYIVPEGDALRIEVRVDPIHVDEVYPGQPARVRLPAFDARATPELLAVIADVSADAFADERTGAAFYRATIALADGEQARLSGGQALVPGMPVEAFIRTGDRTPLAYLLSPLTDYFARAFREG
ncbi:HlyD family secretion protein [Hasllibacter halocynthiae]|uniref:Membrane fusion protein (MFP) family protein n=1 Tax=Hasllibacter halocynthiae TaxID=595589 RepID=A0A2T0X1V4_9RHOB|nr:HlyD family type I secretion periplasmic adaptor subunit [Hasllibacter halocynthiae]PRY92932.1 HlyD family secretion protein [Hasllibacter halocynthiae]